MNKVKVKVNKTVHPVLHMHISLFLAFSKESHRGTLLGMTRFRDVMDDMPILGYGRGDVHHDRQGGLGS